MFWEVVVKRFFLFWRVPKTHVFQSNFTVHSTESTRAQGAHYKRVGLTVQISYPLVAAHSNKFLIVVTFTANNHKLLSNCLTD
jgi:hypothetical protein